jgi:membrane dipeptidase
MELTTTATGIRQIINAGKVAGVLALEGCDGLQEDAAILRLLYRLGVRMVGLTWERRNAFADGTGVPNPGGLTKIGRTAVREMAGNQVILDVSHLAEPGFWDALDLVDGPIIASHCNARAVLDHPRNLTDDQIRAIAETGGVVGLNFVGFYIDSDHPTRERLADHLTHIVDLVGIEHVGIGSDFLEGPLRDLAKTALADTNIDPALLDFWIEDGQQSDDLPLFAETLKGRGFQANEIAAVMGGNFMRVFEQVWG